MVSLSSPHEDTARRCPSEKKEKGLTKNPTMLAARLQPPELWEIKAVFMPPRLWHSAIVDWTEKDRNE